jgi:hypothetical protein
MFTLINVFSSFILRKQPYYNLYIYGFIHIFSMLLDWALIMEMLKR